MIQTKSAQNVSEKSVIFTTQTNPTALDLSEQITYLMWDQLVHDLKDPTTIFNFISGMGGLAKSLNASNNASNNSSGADQEKQTILINANASVTFRAGGQYAATAKSYTMKNDGTYFEYINTKTVKSTHMLKKTNQVASKSKINTQNNYVLVNTNLRLAAASLFDLLGQNNTQGATLHATVLSLRMYMLQMIHTLVRITRAQLLSNVLYQSTSLSSALAVFSVACMAKDLAIAFTVEAQIESEMQKAVDQLTESMEENLEFIKKMEGASDKKAGAEIVYDSTAQALNKAVSEHQTLLDNYQESFGDNNNSTEKPPIGTLWIYYQLNRFDDYASRALFYDPATDTFKRHLFRTHYPNDYTVDTKYGKRTIAGETFSDSRFAGARKATWAQSEAGAFYSDGRKQAQLQKYLSYLKQEENSLSLEDQNKLTQNKKAYENFQKERQAINNLQEVNAYEQQIETANTKLLSEIDTAKKELDQLKPLAQDSWENFSALQDIESSEDRGPASDSSLKSKIEKAEHDYQLKKINNEKKIALNTKQFNLDKQNGFQGLKVREYMALDKKLDQLAAEAGFTSQYTTKGIHTDMPLYLSQDAIGNKLPAATAFSDAEMDMMRRFGQEGSESTAALAGGTHHQAFVKKNPDVKITTPVDFKNGPFTQAFNKTFVTLNTQLASEASEVSEAARALEGFGQRARDQFTHPNTLGAKYMRPDLYEKSLTAKSTLTLYAKSLHEKFAQNFTNHFTVAKRNELAEVWKNLSAVNEKQNIFQKKINTELKKVYSKMTPDEMQDTRLMFGASSVGEMNAKMKGALKELYQPVSVEEQAEKNKQRVQSIKDNISTFETDIDNNIKTLQQDIEKNTQVIKKAKTDFETFEQNTKKFKQGMGDNISKLEQYYQQYQEKLDEANIRLESAEATGLDVTDVQRKLEAAQQQLDNFQQNELAADYKISQDLAQPYSDSMKKLQGNFNDYTQILHNTEKKINEFSAFKNNNEVKSILPDQLQSSKNHLTDIENLRQDVMKQGKELEGYRTRLSGMTGHSTGKNPMNQLKGLNDQLSDDKALHNWSNALQSLEIQDAKIVDTSVQKYQDLVKGMNKEFDELVDKLPQGTTFNELLKENRTVYAKYSSKFSPLNKEVKETLSKIQATQVPTSQGLEDYKKFTEKVQSTATALSNPQSLGIAENFRTSDKWEKIRDNAEKIVVEGKIKQLKEKLAIFNTSSKQEIPKNGQLGKVTIGNISKEVKMSESAYQLRKQLKELDEITDPAQLSTKTDKLFDKATVGTRQDGIKIDSIETINANYQTMSDAFSASKTAAGNSVDGRATHKAFWKQFVENSDYTQRKELLGKIKNSSTGLKNTLSLQQPPDQAVLSALQKQADLLDEASATLSKASASITTRNILIANTFNRDAANDVVKVNNTKQARQLGAFENMQQIQTIEDKPFMGNKQSISLNSTRGVGSDHAFLTSLERNAEFVDNAKKLSAIEQFSKVYGQEVGDFFKEKTSLDSFFTFADNQLVKVANDIQPAVMRAFPTSQELKKTGEITLNMKPRTPEDIRALKKNTSIANLTSNQKMTGGMAKEISNKLQVTKISNELATAQQNIAQTFKTQYASKSGVYHDLINDVKGDTLKKHLIQGKADFMLASKLSAAADVEVPKSPNPPSIPPAPQGPITMDVPKPIEMPAKPLFELIGEPTPTTLEVPEPTPLKNIDVPTIPPAISAVGETIEVKPGTSFTAKKTDWKFAHTGTAIPLEGKWQQAMKQSIRMTRTSLKASIKDGLKAVGKSSAQAWKDAGTKFKEAVTGPTNSQPPEKKPPEKPTGPTAETEKGTVSSTAGGTVVQTSSVTTKM